MKPLKRRMKNRLMKLAHVQAGNHLGLDRTHLLLATRYFWPGLRRDLHEGIMLCTHCVQKHKTPFSKRVMQHRQLCGRFNQKLYVDLVGPLQPPDMYRGEEVKHLLTVMDGYTKYARVCPVPDQKKATIINALLETWIFLFGCPESMP